MTRTLTLLSLICATTSPFAVAEDRITASQLLPESCILFAEFPNPDELLETVLNHPIRHHIEQVPQWQQATEQDGYRKFLAGRQFFALQMGQDWDEAAQALTANGITVAVDAKTEGAILLVQADDEKTMKRFQEKLLVLTQLGKSYQEAQKEKYRDVQAYEVENALIAVFDNWLLATNKPDAGKAVIDLWLDRSEECLANNEQFQTARKTESEALQGWGWANLEQLKTLGGVKELFQGKTDNPGAELLVGGIMSTLTQTPFATAEFSASDESVSLALRTPHKPEWVTEERTFYFGPDSSGKGPKLNTVPDTLFTLSTYRDVGEMWLRAGDLFNERINDQFAEADASLTTLFAGRDFGEDILGSLTPEIGFIAARQSFEDILPKPAIKLPAFALVAQMKSPETMTRELRRTFQSMVGFFNVLGAMEGRPQLEMDMNKRDDGSETVTTIYIPEPDDEQLTAADMIFNFSPSIGFQDSTVIVSSSQSLVEQLLDAKPVDGLTDSNSQSQLNADVLQKVLKDNEQQLISQNMLEEGNSRDEAEVAIGLLLQAVSLVQDVSARLDVTQQELLFNFNITLETELE